MSNQNKTELVAEPKVSNNWIPVLVGTLLCIVVALVWWIQNEHEQTKQSQIVETEADLLASYIKTDMRSRIPSLQRIVNRWQDRGGTPQEEFLNDTLDYVSNIPGFQALEWVDKIFM